MGLALRGAQDGTSGADRKAFSSPAYAPRTYCQQPRLAPLTGCIGMPGPALPELFPAPTVTAS